MRVYRRDSHSVLRVGGQETRALFVDCEANYMCKHDALLVIDADLVLNHHLPQRNRLHFPAGFVSIS